MAKPETEAECRARGGTLVRHPRTGAYLSCYPPPTPKPIDDIADKVKRAARDRAILLIGAAVVIAFVYLND